MKVVVLLILGLLLLGGAGAGSWVLYNRYFAPPVEEEEHKEEPPPKIAYVFARVPPVTFSVIGVTRTEQHITVVASIQVTDDDAAQKVKENAPVMTNAFITALYNAVGKGVIVTGDKVNLMEMKRVLLDACRRNPTVLRVLGEGVVLDVLIQSINQRKL
ncbi:flagellar FliL protein [Azospirillaceae bacterium]